MEKENGKDIRDSAIYNSLVAKLNVDIELKDGNKIIKGISKWKSIKTDMTTNDKDNVAIRTGKINDICVIDIDKPKDGECDGIELFEQKVGKINELNTLVTKSIRGGYHIYFKHTTSLKDSVKLKYMNNIYSIDVRNTGLIFEGKGYSLLNDNEIQSIPDSLLEVFKVDTKIIKSEDLHFNVKFSNEYMVEILDNLVHEYYDNYLSWFNVVSCLKNIGNDLQLAKYFSKKSKKYDEQALLKLWNSLEILERPGMGSLLYFLKESVGKIKYDNLLRKFRKVKNPILNDFDACKVFKELFKQKLFTTNEKIFACNEYGIWKEIKKTDKLLMLCIEDYHNFLTENGHEYSLLSRSFRNGFLTDALIYLQSNYELNNNPYLFPFTNGVYDILNGTFRVASPNEFITETCGYEYKFEESTIANNFITDVFPDKENREYLLKIIASHLVDIHQREEFFCLYNKNGNNGKSTFVNLINSVFGTFFYECKSDLLLNSKFLNVEGASPVLSMMKGKRFIAYQEIKKNEKLCATTIKKLTGGDAINSRGLYEDTCNFKINGLHMLSCQAPPGFDIIDGAVIRRTRMIAMETEFVEEITKPYHKKVQDINIKDLKYSMFQLLIENYTSNIKKGIDFCPVKIQQASKMYFEKTNLLKQFVNEYFIKDIDSYTTKNEIKILLTNRELSREYEFGKVNTTIDSILEILDINFIEQKKIKNVKYRNVIEGYKLKSILDDEDEL